MLKMPMVEKTNGTNNRYCEDWLPVKNITNGMIQLENGYYDADGNFHSYEYVSNKYIFGNKDYIYFTYKKKSNSYIYRIKTNGKNLKCLGMGRNPKPYRNKIYYLRIIKTDDYYHFEINDIYKMNLNGSNKTCIKKSKYISDFSIYNSNIYYIYVYDHFDATSIPSYLCKMNLNGNNNKKLVDYNGYDYYEILNMGGFYKGYIYIYTDKGFYKLKLSNTALPSAATPFLRCASFPFFIINF